MFFQLLIVACVVAMQQETGGEFSIKYGTGAVHGNVVTDVLQLAEPPIVVPDQGFGLAQDHSADFASASCDGIFVSARPPMHPCMPLVLLSGAYVSQFLSLVYNTQVLKQKACRLHRNPNFIASASAAAVFAYIIW